MAEQTTFGGPSTEFPKENAVVGAPSALKKPIKRRLMQVWDTIAFEWQRNLKKTIALLVVLVGLSVLIFFTNWYQYENGRPLPEDPLDYVSIYLGLFSFMVYVIGAAYGAPIIATDFEKETGNLLFPKISRDRLLLGRMIGNYLLVVLQVTAYFTMIVIFTAITMEEVPGKLAASFAWALFFLLGVMSFVVLFSSFMKSTSFTLVVSLLLLLIGFSIIEQLVVIFTGIEPLFSLTYYSNIISNSLDMPDIRKVTFDFGGGPPGTGEDGFSFTQWITPNYPGAFIGILVYTVLSLLGAYFLFQRRQGK